MADIIHVRDVKSSGTDGGSSTGGTDHIRVLNTVVLNEISGASLATNQVTLPAGTYDVFASASGFKGDRHRAFLYNVTDVGVELLGPGGTLMAAGDSIGSTVYVIGRIVLAAEKVLELRHYVQTSFATSGLGLASDDTRSEIYAEFIAEKVA